MIVQYVQVIGQLFVYNLIQSVKKCSACCIIFNYRNADGNYVTFKLDFCQKHYKIAYDFGINTEFMYW